MIDYESGDLIPFDLNVEKCGIIYRHINEIIFSETELNEKNYEKLFEIKKNENSEFYLNFNKIEYDDTENISSLNNAWILLKPQKMENNTFKYNIKEGDILKIGRITIRITEIKNKKENNDYYLNGKDISNNSINIINSNDNSRVINEIVEISNIKKNFKEKKQLNSVSTGANQTVASTKQSVKNIIKEGKVILESKNDINIVNENDSLDSKENLKREDLNFSKRKLSKNKICRICYMEEDDSEENPLLNPCICSGSMKYIHFNCLRQWINSKCYSKIENTNIDCSIYKIKPLECELCKSKFPDLIVKNENTFNISEFKPEYDNYLIFESLTLDKNKNKYIYIVALNDNNILIGRDKASNILFSDISVSRIHCKLINEKNNIYICDNDSTFGTLVLIQSNSLNLEGDLPLYIQIGRTFFKILPMKKKSKFLCCNVSEKPYNNFYFEQNKNKVFYIKKITKLNLNNNKNNECQKIEENKNDSYINIKKIVIKKSEGKENNSIICGKKDKMFDLGNYNENNDKENNIKNKTFNNISLKKINFNNDHLIEQENLKNNIEINKKNENISENEIKNENLIEKTNNDINDINNSNNSQSIYLDDKENDN